MVDTTIRTESAIEGAAVPILSHWIDGRPVDVLPGESRRPVRLCPRAGMGAAGPSHEGSSAQDPAPGSRGRPREGGTWPQGAPGHSREPPPGQPEHESPDDHEGDADRDKRGYVGSARRIGCSLHARRCGRR